MINMKLMIEKCIKRIGYSKRQVLLWENPSPPASMGATTLSAADLAEPPGNFSEIKIICDWNDANYSLAVSGRPGYQIRVQSPYNVSASAAIYLKERQFDIASDSISISACSSKTSSSASSKSTSNGYLVPQKIYGIRRGGSDD